MAIPVWPPSLPQAPLASGYAEAHPDLTVRTSVDKGPARVARRSSLGVTVMSLQFILSAAQVATLETFVYDTLVSGVYRFEWVHPRTGDTIELRFLPSGESMYSLAPVSGDYWAVGCQMEILP
jgi:hypothetical protein